MQKLRACKSSLYELVAQYVHNLPPARNGTVFKKFRRGSEYALEWITPEWNCGYAFFSCCLGNPILTIEIKSSDTGRIVQRSTYRLRVSDLKARGMIVEVTTEIERRRAANGKA